MHLRTAICCVPALASLSVASADTGLGGTLLLGLHPQRQEHRLVRRNAVEETVFDAYPWYYGGGYYMNISVGTPPQILTVLLDTAGSDLFVDANTAAACQQSVNNCRGGEFDPTQSSSYAKGSGNFTKDYGDGEVYQCEFAKDTVTIGDIALEDVTFGVATVANSTNGFATGAIGLGYSEYEVSPPYPNIPDLLVNSGAIPSRLYSIFLSQNPSDPTGAILFGGVDTSKFTGDLVTLDLLPTVRPGTNIEAVGQFVVAITGVSIKGSNSQITILSDGDATGKDLKRSLPVLLDTSDSGWTVPTSLYNDILNLVGADNIDSDGTLACSLADTNISLTVEFGSKISIDVPFSNLVAPLYDPSPVTTNGEPQCTLNLFNDTNYSQDESSAGFLYLGTSILQSMYVVFDLDNGQVSIAQAVNDTATSNIIVVKAGPSGLANAVRDTVSTAPANTNAINPIVDATLASFSTASSAVGTATGVKAIPIDARTSAAVTQTGSAFNPASSATNVNFNTGSTQASSGTATASAAATGTAKSSSAATPGLLLAESNSYRGLCMLLLVAMMLGAGLLV